MIPFPSSFLQPTLASIPAFPTFGESLKFQFNGLLVVFTALILIWCLVELVGWGFRLHARIKRLEGIQPAAPSPTPSAVPSAVPAPAVAAPAAPAAASELTPEIVAVIMAAVHVKLAGVPHRIQAIAPFGAGVDWAREGRRTIFASHRPR